MQLTGARLVHGTNYGALEDIGASGFRLKLRNTLQASFNYNAFHSDCMQHDEKTLALAVGPVPSVCEIDDASVILLIATDTQLTCPCDLSDVLKTYGRLIANWLSKHDEWLLRKHGLYDMYNTEGDSATTTAEGNGS